MHAFVLLVFILAEENLIVYNNYISTQELDNKYERVHKRLEKRRDAGLV